MAGPRSSAPLVPRYQSMGMSSIIIVFFGVTIGSLIALFFRGGLQASGRRGGSMSSLFFSPDASYQRSQAAHFLRSMDDSSSATLSGGMVGGDAVPGGAGGGAAGVASSGAPAAPQCDCEACTALLDALGVAVPAHWGDFAVGECECGTCTALMRLSLQAQGIAGLEVNGGFLAGAFGDVRALLGKLQALKHSSSSDSKSSGTAGSCACPQCPAAPAAQGGGGALECPPCAAAPPEAPRPCPQPPPCPATPACSAEQGSGSSPGGPAQPPTTLSLHNQLSDAGAPPVWSAALAVRGVPPPPCHVASAFGATPATCANSPIAVPTRCVVGRHEDHWNFFVNMVTGTRAPMALMRYVDGERMIMQGTEVGTATQAWGEDKWQWEGGDSKMARDMKAGLKGHYGEPVFYAFASPRDDEHGLRYYLDNTEATCGQITYANLWINGYYHRTKAMLLHTIATQRERIVLVANHEGLKKYPPCTANASGGGDSIALAGCIPVPDSAVHSWEDDKKRADLLDPALALAAKLPPGALFVVCAGPLSKPLIAALWKANKNHQYIDFGSASE
jgi:hypothetical protein